MARVAIKHELDDAGLEALLRPRTDLVLERAVGDGRFEAEHGPVDHYERRVEVDGDHILETIDFHLAVPYWSWLFVLPFRRALRRRHDRPPWWAPPDRLDARAAKVLGLLCAMALVTGYLLTVVTQTITYARDEFGADRSAQTATLAAVRAGALIAMVLAATADRRGRRRLLIVSATLGCLLCATGAFVPNLAWLGVSQTLARGMAGGLALLLTIVSAEEMPSGTRAYAFSLVTMAGGLGAGVCLWALPLADISQRSWRFLYVIPLIALPMVAAVGRRLPETQRFVRPHAEVDLSGHGRRFWLLAWSFFLLSSFGAPAGQVTNDFLRVERGFSAARISLFVILTSTPAAIGIVAGGRLADVHGRRIVGAVGIIGGTLLTVVTFVASGWAMWVWSVLGSMIAGLTVPIIGVYRPELFPTSLRGRASGIIEVISLTGSAVGLLITGWLADKWGHYAGPLAILAVPSMAVAVLLLVAYPETARRSLEDLNPEDR